VNALTALLGTSPAIFIGLTVIMVGGAAILTGRAVANNWKPAWQVVAAAFGLALADRFLTYALFQGELVNLWGIFVHFLVLAGMGLAAWRIAKVGKLVSQYPWRYRRTSPFGYTELKDV
jgi:branched-chain amino acid transport system ATP-binding protein